MVFSICMLNVANAQEVTVTGMGTDKDSAIRDATRLAVEQIVGTFIDSRTLMENLIIQMDEVYKKSQGFIKKIQILSESRVNDSTYKVTARIDVDTDPNGKLIDEITMLMRLNDPRITVIIFNVEQSSTSRNESAEGILVDKLLSMNFSHVLYPDQVIKQNDAELLNSIASGKSGLFKGKKDNATDYLVVGKCNRITNPVMVPDFKTAEMTASALVNVRSNFQINVIKYDTGEFVGTFTAEGKGIGTTDEHAKKIADNAALNSAAEKLGDTLKKFSAKSSNGLTFTITANSESNIEQILNSLRSISLIDNIQLREHSGNKIILSVETASRPHEVVAMLKSRTKLGVFVEKMTASGCSLRIT